MESGNVSSSLLVENCNESTQYQVIAQNINGSDSCQAFVSVETPEPMETDSREVQAPRSVEVTDEINMPDLPAADVNEGPNSLQRQVHDTTSSMMKVHKTISTSLKMHDAPYDNESSNISPIDDILPPLPQIDTQRILTHVDNFDENRYKIEEPHISNDSTIVRMNNEVSVSKSKAIPPSFISKLVDNTVVAGESASFTVEVEGSPKPTVSESSGYLCSNSINETGLQKHSLSLFNLTESEFEQKLYESIEKNIDNLGDVNKGDYGLADNDSLVDLAYSEIEKNYPVRFYFGSFGETSDPESGNITPINTLNKSLDEFVEYEKLFSPSKPPESVYADEYIAYYDDMSDFRSISQSPIEEEDSVDTFDRNYFQEYLSHYLDNDSTDQSKDSESYSSFSNRLIAQLNSNTSYIGRTRALSTILEESFTTSEDDYAFSNERRLLSKTFTFDEESEESFDEITDDYIANNSNEPLVLDDLKRLRYFTSVLMSPAYSDLWWEFLSKSLNDTFGPMNIPKLSKNSFCVSKSRLQCLESYTHQLKEFDSSDLYVKKNSNWQTILNPSFNNRSNFLGFNDNNFFSKTVLQHMKNGVFRSISGDDHNFFQFGCNVVPEHNIDSILIELLILYHIYDCFVDETLNYTLVDVLESCIDYIRN